MAEQQDYAGLDWVKEEIERTLTEARHALEKHQEEPGNPAHITAGQAAFAQVQGALKMLQHEGATHLSLEMTKLTEALINQRVPDARMALEVLMQGVLQLPGYIQQTISSGTDRPLALLPLINELRQLRGEDPLPEATFFFPDLSQQIDPVEPPQLDSLEQTGLVPLLRKIRQKYQLTLAGYLRDQNRQQQIQVLSKIFAKLQDLSWGAPLSPLWEASVALTEGLENQSIEQNLHVTNLLRELDVQIRLFIKQGAPFINTLPNEELFRGLLYYVATSEGQEGFTGALKARYQLEEVLAQASQEASETLIGIDTTAPVVEALNYELTGIKEALDLYLLSSAPDPLVLENQLPIIQQVADTLAILGMDDLRASLKQKKELIQSVIDTGQNAEEHLMDMAGTILQLESALSRYAAGESIDQDDSSPLLEEVYQAVIKEARHHLDQTKDAIVDFVDSHHHQDFLNQIPELLHKVHGGLAMTPLTRAANLVKTCSSHIKLEWIENSKTPEKMELEQLADAVTSIEYYLERLSDKGQEENEAILDVAEESLSALKEQSDNLSGQNNELQLDEQSFIEGSAPITLEDESSNESSVEEEALTASLTLANKGVEVSPYDVVKFEFSTSSSVKVESPATPTPEVITPEPETASNLETAPELEIEAEEESFIDDELLEVFIEEAGEVQTQLAETVPAWLNNQEDDASLKEIRRAFHTLKGSGRMVGANVVGELAWSIENMLNRMIDGTIQASPELRGLVNRVTQMLPSLITDFSEQSQLLTHDVLVCMEHADALSRGEKYIFEDADDQEVLSEAFDIEPELEVQLDDEAVTPSAPFEDTVPETLETEEIEQEAYDIQLLNVFLAEARSHLDVVLSFVEQVKSQGGKRQISDQVQRSLHTLKGIALMAEIAPLAEVIVALEKNIKDFRAHLIPADDRVISMLDKGIELIQSGLDQLVKSPKQPKLDSENYLSWLEALHAQLIIEQHKAQATTRKYTGGQKTDLFVTNDLGLLLDADEYLSTWRENLPRKELNLFQKELTILAERSSEARLTALAELCDVLLGVLNYLDKHESLLPGVLAAPLSNGFEALVDMMNQVTAQQTPVPPQTVFTELRQSLEALLAPTPATELNSADSPILEHQDFLEDIDVDLSEPSAGSESSEAYLSEDSVLESLTEDQPDPVEEIVIEENLVEETLVEEALIEEIVIETSELPKEPWVTDSLPADSSQTATPQPVLNIELEEHDLELIELFLEEASDLAEDCNHTLEDWLNNRQNLTPLTDLQRSLHTLKGSARMADQPEMGDLSHVIEEIYSSIANGRSTVNKAPLGLLQTAHDQIEQMLQALRKHQTPPSPVALIEQLEQWVLNNDIEDIPVPLATTDEPIEILPDYLGHAGQQTTDQDLEPQPVTDDDVQLTVEESTQREVISEITVELSTEAVPETTPEESVTTTTRVETPVTHSAVNNLAKSNELVRVPAQLLEQLLNLSGESSINRGRIEQQIQNISSTLEEMDSTIDRVKEQLRRLDTETQAQIISTYEDEQADNPEFDPLEMDQYSELTQLSRSLVESATDLKDLKEGIQEKNRDAETLLLQQSRTLIELQEKLMQARMVSFSRLLPRLRKITRQLSTELDKPINLNVSNAEGEMDRTMLERILAPLEHMLRNAIDHGIEASSNERIAKGKPATGSLELSITRDGADIVLELSDDGRGINLQAVHAKALEKHLITPEDELKEHEIAQLILEPGFSTATSVTQISGRGVGLDVVNTEIRQMGGSIQIDSELDKGTSFKLRLPFTLSVNRALMVQIEDSLYALPMQAIDGITTIAPDTLKDCYQNRTPLEYGGVDHNVMFLGELLGSKNPKIQPEQCPLVIVKRGGQSLALHVDEIVGGREIFTKSLGPQFAGLTGVNGATILGDGRVAIIIDPAALVRRHRIEKHYVELADKTTQDVEVAHRVLVVDDSVTVRKVTTRLLERQGFTVETARDGIEAMTKLSENAYDIILLDIEMPKMDGYEVASAVRNDSSLKALPIIMITSRTGEKHKARAFSLGVNDYLGKPFQEAILLEAINKLIGQKS